MIFQRRHLPGESGELHRKINNLKGMRERYNRGATGESGERVLRHRGEWGPMGSKLNSFVIQNIRVIPRSPLSPGPGDRWRCRRHQTGLKRLEAAQVSGRAASFPPKAYVMRSARDKNVGNYARQLRREQRASARYAQLELVFICLYQYPVPNQAASFLPK